MKLDLSSLLEGAARVAIVGIGSDMRGDDAVGIEVVRRLRRRLSSPNVLLIEAGVAPENFTAEIKKFEPSHVILIDAADFGSEPGAAILSEPEAIAGRPISTHTMPLSLLASYLRAQTAAKVVLLGIQPSSTGMGARMSEKVKRTVDELSATLLAQLRHLTLPNDAQVISMRSWRSL